MKKNITLVLSLCLSCVFGHFANAQTNTNHHFETWLTVKVGTFKDARAIWNALEKVGCNKDWRTGEYVATNALMNSTFAVSETVKEIELVKLTIADLGFSIWASQRELYDRAKSAGLEACPQEVGPQLLLQHADRLKEDFFHIGSKPMKVNGVENPLFGDLEVFYIGYPSGRLLELYTMTGNPSDLVTSDKVWVFAKKR